MEPVNVHDFFTKKAIAEKVAEVSPITLNKYTQNGKLFPPVYETGHSYSPNPRKYYSCADAMRISLILHGAIMMKNIRHLLDTELVVSESHKKEIVEELIQQSFKIVRNQIISGNSNPVNLSEYLIDTPQEKQLND